MAMVGILFILFAILIMVLAIRGGYKFLPPFAKVQTVSQIGAAAGQSTAAAIQNIIDSQLNPPTVGPH